MFRRRPSRTRFGFPSYGRRVPACNFAAIREEVRAMNVIVSSIREGAYRIVENDSPQDPTLKELGLDSPSLKKKRSTVSASVLELFPPA